MRDKLGQLDVTATIAGSGGLLGYSAAKDTVQLRLVDDATVSPTAMELFHHPAATGQGATDMPFVFIYRIAAHIVACHSERIFFSWVFLLNLNLGLSILSVFR